MARLIEGKRFVGIEHGEGDSGAYVFRGGNSCVRVFTGLTKAAALALPNAIDVFGNPITAETFLPGTLVYCEGK